MKKKTSKRVSYSYSFKGRLWKNKSKGAWHFVSLPKKVSNKIRDIHHGSEEGWGRLKATATIGETVWDTAIWFDTKAGTYLLAVKSLIRKKESLSIDDNLTITLELFE